MDMARLPILLLWIVCVVRCQDTQKSCGKSDDITNIGILSHAIPVFASKSSFGQLNGVCYGNVKNSLEELKSTVTEGDPCIKKATVVLAELKSICFTIKRVYSFNTMFQTSLSFLNQIHKDMDYISKFAEIVPAVSKIRKLVMEKILPMVMEALEYAYIGVRNVVVYFSRFLGQMDSDDLHNLVIEIKKKGTTACTDSTSMGKLLSKVVGELTSTRESSKVLLQAIFEIQNCANKECPSRPEACIDCWKFNNNFGHAFPLIKKWKEGLKVCPKKMDEVINQLNVTDKLDAIFDIGFNTMIEIDQFLKIFSGSLAKSVKSIAPVEKHLLACCPCGRPANPKRSYREICVVLWAPCGDKTTNLPLHISSTFRSKAKTADILVCLHSILCKNEWFWIRKESFLRKCIPISKYAINLDIYIPSAQFQIDVPNYAQQCFGSSSFQMKFTKLCSLPIEPIDIKFRSPILPGLRQASITRTYSSLPEEIKLSCTKVPEAFKHFGKTMAECSDRITIAASTCGRSSSDHDHQVDYCPCQIPQDKADTKQPYCVVWKKSHLKTCSSHCLEKGYKPGKNPAGHNAQMDKTYGYPVCDNLKYYCRVSDVRVRNGTVKCASEYTFHDGKCQIVPNPGFICAVDVIECGSSGDPIKGVCWNYRLIDCARDNGKHYPVCSCKNNDTFTNGKLVCQYGNFQSVAPTPNSVLELRKTSNCFERLGLDKDIKKDCGASMSPCTIQKPTVSPYERCSYTVKVNPIKESKPKNKPENKPENKAQNKPEDKGGMNGALIAIISLAATAALSISIIVFYYCYKNKWYYCC